MSWILVGAAAVSVGTSTAQAIKQGKEAKKKEKQAGAEKGARDEKMRQMEKAAEQRAGVTKAPGMAEAEEALDRNTAQTLSNVTRGTTSSATALNTAANVNQQQNQADLALAQKNKQYIDNAQQNLQAVRGGSAAMSESDRKESQARSDALAAARDANIEQAANAPLTTAMILSGGGAPTPKTNTTPNWTQTSKNQYNDISQLAQALKGITY